MFRRLSLVLLVALFLTSCGGLPESYEESIGLGGGVSPITTCSDPSQGTTIAAIHVFDNPGPYPIEVTSVEAVDTSLEMVEVFVVTTPTNAAAFGSASLSDPGGSDPDIQTAWENRAEPPASIASGMRGNLVVLIPPPENGVNFVREFSIDVTVDGQSQSYDWVSLRMVGSNDDCEGFAASFSE